MLPIVNVNKGFLFKIGGIQFSNRSHFVSNYITRDPCKTNGHSIKYRTSIIMHSLQNLLEKFLQRLNVLNDQQPLSPVFLHISHPKQKHRKWYRLHENAMLPKSLYTLLAKYQITVNVVFRSLQTFLFSFQTELLPWYWGRITQNVFLDQFHSLLEI